MDTSDFSQTDLDNLAYGRSTFDLANVKSQSFFDTLVQFGNLALAELYRGMGRTGRARKHMDRVLESKAEIEAFMLAYDGRLKAFESDFSFSCARFEEGVELARKSDEADDKYTAKWCELWLTVNDGYRGWPEIRQAGEEACTAWSEASRLVQILLPCVSAERLNELYGDRKAKMAFEWRLTSQEYRLSGTINFDQ